VANSSLRDQGLPRSKPISRLVSKGLEPLPTDPSLTVEKLLRWWLEGYSDATPSHLRWESSIRKHLLSSSLSALPVIALRPGHVETFLQQKKREGLAPRALNHLR